jgi:hypothetical protein
MPRSRARSQWLRSARAEREPLPVHRLSPIRDAAYALNTPSLDDPLRARCEEPAPPAVATAVDSAQGRYVRPLTLDATLDLLAQNPGARLVAGSTDWGVELNIRHRPRPVEHRRGPARGVARAGHQR